MVDQSKTFVPTAVDLDIFEDTLNLYAKSITADMRQSRATGGRARHR